MISRAAARELILFAAKKTTGTSGHLTTIARMLALQEPRVILQVGSGPELAVLAKYADLDRSVSVFSIDHSSGPFSDGVKTLGSLRHCVNMQMSQPVEGVMFDRGMYHDLSGAMVGNRVTVDMVVIGKEAVPGSRAAQIVRAWRMVTPQGCMWISGVKEGDKAALSTLAPREKPQLTNYLEVISNDVIDGVIAAGYGSPIKYKSLNPMIDSCDGFCAPRVTLLSIDSRGDEGWLTSTLASSIVNGTNVIVSCEDEKVFNSFDLYDLAGTAKSFGARGVEFSIPPNQLLDGLLAADRFDAKVLMNIPAGWRLDKRPRFIDAIGDALAAVTSEVFGAVSLAGSFKESGLEISNSQPVYDVLPPGVLSVYGGDMPFVPSGAFVANVDMESSDPLYPGWTSVGIVTPGPMGAS